MRPARKGPENFRRRVGRRRRGGAPSMRPARKGPENPSKAESAETSTLPSMRPARKGPENVIREQEWEKTWRALQ